MTAVQVLASPGIISIIGKSLCAPAFTVSSLSPGVAPTEDSVIIIHANSKVFGTDPEIPDACGAAAWLRRAGCTNPIVWLASEPLELKTTPGDVIANTAAQMDGGKIDLPWFAPLYDVALRVPQENTRLREAVEIAQARSGKRQPLVEAAITRALQTHLESRGAHEDHLWKNLEAVLRFLRGAQCEWMIHPDDAKAVITELREQIKNAPPEYFGKLQSEVEALVTTQEVRWEEYRTAFRKRWGNAETDKTFQKHQEAGLPYRLLLIDDQHERLGWKVLLERVLAPYGFAVESNDGQDFDALKDKLKAPNHYDVILLDLNLEPPLAAGAKTKGKENLIGLDLLDDIRKLKLAPHTPVILFTGYERLGLERRRQELGLLGYIVKQEQSDGKQDAASYYRRLVDLCRESVDHGIRALLLEWLESWETSAPKLSRVAGARCASALLELDDPLVACHQAGLAAEAAFTAFILPAAPPGASPDWAATYGDRIKSEEWKKELRGLKADSPYEKWSSLLSPLRNSAAHPDKEGGNALNWLDATFMGALTVFSLHLLGQRPDSWRHGDLRVSLATLVLCRCADELQDLHQDFEHILRNTPPFQCFVDSLSETVRILRKSAGELRELQAMANPYDKEDRETRNDTHRSALNDSLKQLHETAQAVLVETAKLFAVGATTPVENMDEAAQYLRGISLDGSLKYKPACPGFGHMGLTARVLLCEESLDVLTGRVAPSADTIDYDHFSLRTLALTRLVQWSISSVISRPNPEFEKMFCQLIQGTPQCSMESFDLSIAVCELNSSPWLAPAVHELTIRFIFQKAVELLLEPNYNRLKRNTEIAEGIEVQEHTKLKRLENQTGEIQKQLDKAREDKKGAEDQYEKHGEAMGNCRPNTPNWTVHKNLFDGAEQQMKDSTSKIAELEPKQAPLNQQLDEQRRLVDKMEKDRDAREQLLQLHEELNRLDALKEIEEADFEPLILSIVAELSSGTLAETVLALKCVRAWLPTPQREDLPDLLSDLEKRWKGTVVV